MAARTLRSGVVGAVVVAAALATAPAAWACNLPDAGPDGGTSADPGPGGPGIEPGGAIGFVIGDIDEGASFSVSVDGHPAGSGVDDDGRNGYRGAVPMPELGGPSRAVSVDIVVTHVSSAQEHENGSWPTSFTVRYSAPAPPAAAAPQTPADAAPQPVPQETPATTGLGESAPTGGGPTGGPPGPSRGDGGGPTSPTSPGGHPATRLPGAQELSDVPTAVRESLTDGQAGFTPARPAALRTAGERARPAPVVPERILDRPPLSMPAGEPLGTDGAQPVPLLLLVALAVVMLLGLGGAGVAWMRWRPAPDSPPDGVLLRAPGYDPVEAELQELLAEERLKRLAREETPDVPEPAGPARASPG